MKDTYGMASSCIQGGYPRPMEGYHLRNQGLGLGPHSPPEAWQYPPVIQNQTPSSDIRNDSGINSGSDFHSSSPGSEEISPSRSSPIKVEPSQLRFCSTPINPRALSYHSSNMVAYPSDPSEYLARPGTSSEPQIKKEPEDYINRDLDNTLTASESPSPEPQRMNDALKCLEMSVERNLTMPVSSPRTSEASMDDDKKFDTASEEFDESGHRVPRINSHGKIKTFKCKQCSFVAITKFSFWEHQRQHIKPEKLLTCMKCPFVTEYKHHLEYHLRNHNGSKPFKCEHCDYTCVNKSMLNSHKKSHSNIYQYRCANCHYASKYCHSLKLHLRKYNHQPAMVLNPDGTPNPNPIIDVYGTRRGPKVKPIRGNEGEEQPLEKKMRLENSSTPPLLPLPLQQLMTQAGPLQMTFGYPWLQQAMILQNLERLARTGLNPPVEESSNVTEVSSYPEVPTDPDGALDLTKDSEAKRIEDSNLKLDTPSTSSDEDDENTTTMFENVEVVHNVSSSAVEERQNVKPSTSGNNNNYTCQYCSISFGDAVLYTMHMGYHGYQDPFTCNMCGEKCNDKVLFFLHIARNSHS